MSAVMDAKDDLDSRIANALRGDVDSATAGAVLDAVDAETTALMGDIAEARKDALSPLLDAKAATKAKALLDDLTFRQDRLSAARTALVVRVDELRAAEQKAKLDAEREAALIERDALVAVLHDEVPGMIRRWTELVRDISANDARLAAAGLPMESAEAKARGFMGNGMWPDNAGMAQRMRNVKIPLFDRVGLAWGFNGVQDHWAALEG